MFAFSFRFLLGDHRRSADEPNATGVPYTRDLYGKK
jgi:hypothetical protein